MYSNVDLEVVSGSAVAGALFVTLTGVDLWRSFDLDMKVPCERMMIFVSFAVALLLPAQEKIYPHDALDDETGYRLVLAEEFPQLEFGFYHWTGKFLIGALEDFDRHRVLLFLPRDADGAMKLTRNGQRIHLNPKQVFRVKTAGALITHKGSVDLPGSENADAHDLGYWIDLEATDTFSVSIEMKRPVVGAFEASYDPDAKWKTSFHFDQIAQERNKPADAYDITRKSLLKRVSNVLEKKKECLVRFEGVGDLLAAKFLEDQKGDVVRISLEVSDKLIAREDEFQNEMNMEDLEEYLRLSLEAAEISLFQLQLVVEVTPESSDQVFRDTLKTTVRSHFDRVEILKRKRWAKNKAKTSEEE